MMAGKPPSAQYERYPSYPLPQTAELWAGADVWRALRLEAESRDAPPLLIVDAYPGVDLVDLGTELAAHFPGYAVINIEEEAGLDGGQLDATLSPWLTDDPVLGVMSAITIESFYRIEQLKTLENRIAESNQPTIVLGWGAATVASKPHTLVLADLPRWEIQQRQRKGAPNWRANNHHATPQEKFKRGYFVEWRAADKHKMTVLPRADFLLDTTRTARNVTALRGQDYRDALGELCRRPFRVVPFFDPGVWGGQWMRERFGLDAEAPNYAWCFDCVPEENSLLFSHPRGHLETPAINLVLSHPEDLLGRDVFARFGAEFPIRFDMLDTVGGQNLSLQVHPLAGYMRDHFGLSYTQDESYYILDATEKSTVYLGVQTDVDREAMVADLENASRGGPAFPADNYINRLPVKKHDHVSIPAGTIHCSGSNTMVLEISATPYIFTFKLWDWDRVDLNGKPRPLHLDHGVANIQWERDTQWVTENLIPEPEVVWSEGDVVDERTGLHSLEFLETRRCWFSETVALTTHQTVTVMTLVEGDEILIESPQSAFPAFPLHYGETVILPAGVGEFVLSRSPRSTAERFATIRAWVKDA